MPQLPIQSFIDQTDEGRLLPLERRCGELRDLHVQDPRDLAKGTKRQPHFFSNGGQTTPSLSTYTVLQGDQAACSKPPVDIDWKIEF